MLRRTPSRSGEQSLRRSRQCSPGSPNHPARPTRREWRRRLRPRWRCCGDRSRSTSTVTAAEPGSRRRRRRATIWRPRCGRDRWRWRASPTCRTCRSSAAATALCAWCAPRPPESCTAIMSIAWRGWTSWSPSTACAGRCARPISTRRTRQVSRRSSPMSRGWIFSMAGSNGSKKRINAASGMCSSCITRPTTSAISRPAP